MEDIILIGIGGHAHSVVDSIERTAKYNIIGFLDTEEMQGKHFRDYKVLDTDDALEKYYMRGVRNAFITIGYMGHGNIRQVLFKHIKSIGFCIPDIIDDSAIVSADVKIQGGVYIGKRTVVNTGSEVKSMCIINTGAIVEHDCCVGAYSHIAVGSILCGGVIVGESSLIGANATILQERTVGNNCIVAAGMTLNKDLEDNKVIYRNNIIADIIGGGK